MKKIAIIGIGGRTATMFAFELKNVAEVFGFGKKREVELIKNKKLFVKKGEKNKLFEGNVLRETEFPGKIPFDFLFLAIKNPVGPSVNFYYQKIKERKLKPPSLFLSQNGIEAGEEAMSALKEIFGKEAENIQVIRAALFNPVDKKSSDGKDYIIYSPPIRMAVSKIFGPDNLAEITEIFENANFKITPISQKEAKNMEYSKLFLNLIGMTSATRGLSPKEGFLKKEVFKEEIGVIREYIEVVKGRKGKFLNFPHYPVAFFSFLFSLPINILFPFREIFGKLIEGGRMGKPKDLEEIDYYNGAVVKLGEKLGLQTPINKKILEIVKIKK